MDAIVMNKISKSYGDVTVFAHLNLTIPKGQVTCVTGPSGCGKTTLLRLLMGIEQPDQGQILGLDRERISAVFQQDNLCLNLTAITNILMVCQQQINREIVSQHLTRVGLLDIQRQPVRELSGGMSRRVAIVRALLSDANTIFMDEPFKGLDDQLKQQVIRYVKQMIQHKTVIMVTHSASEVSMMNGNTIELRQN